MKVAIAMAACCAALQAGAAGAERVRDIENWTEESHVVFGSVDFYDQGGLDRKERVTLYLLPASASKLDSYRTQKSADGVFYWDLEPGLYLLAGVMLSDAGVATLHIGAEFEVPETHEAIYIGTLEIHADAFGDRLELSDRYEQIAPIFDSRFPGHSAARSNRTLVEPRIGSFSSLSNPCSPEWGLICEDQRLGVTPLTPMVRKLPGLWPDSDSVNPTFSWEPAGVQAVEYDLIVYEAVLASGTIYMRGRVVTYVEGLAEPEYRLPEPLAPGGKYYWSVRLRRGDEVTAWSTQGFAMFAVVAWASGSGQWFQFQTPK